MSQVNEPLATLAFEEWIKTVKDEIETIQDHTKADLPTNAAEIQEDFNVTIKLHPMAAEYLADIDGHLLKCRAQETLDVKSDPRCSELSASERKVIVESRLAHIIRVRDILDATVKSLNQRSFALMSQRAFEREALRLSGHAE